MEGVDDKSNPALRGITLNVFDYVFDQIQDQSGADGREYLVYITYLEIYNEDIKDLLSKNGEKLQLKEGSDKGVYVRNLQKVRTATPGHAARTTCLARRSALEQMLLRMLCISDAVACAQCMTLLSTWHPYNTEAKQNYYFASVQMVVKSAADMHGFLKLGKAQRHTGATAMNADSSRSHSIFTIIVECKETSAGGDASIRVGKLNLVDLAGSERQSKTHVRKLHAADQCCCHAMLSWQACGPTDSTRILIE